MSGKRIADILKRNISMSKQDELDLASALARLEAPGRDIGTVFGRAGAAIQIEAGNVEIDYTKGVVVLNPVTGVPTIELDNLGNAAFGKDLLLPSGTSFSVFSVDQTYNKESVGAGDVLMGDNSADKANLFWDRSAGTLNLRAGTTPSVVLGVDGSLLIGSTSSGMSNLYWDSATGELSLRVGTSDSIILSTDGTLILSNAIRSDNWSLGTSGFNIDAQTGNAEFNNITARGEFHASVFVKGMIDARAGTLLVTKSAGVLAEDMVVPTSGTWYMYIKDPPDGGMLFDSGDYINVRQYFSESLVSLWFTVGTGVDQLDGTQRYECTYSSGDRTSERTYTAGLPAVDFGQSGQGYLEMSADGTGAPYYSVKTWETTPSTITERLRIGNMYGTYGTGSNNRYGIGIGDYSGGNYLSYNAEGVGTFVLKAGAGDLSIDADGISFSGENTKQMRIKYYIGGEEYAYILGYGYGTTPDRNSLIEIRAEAEGSTYDSIVRLKTNIVNSTSKVQLELISNQYAKFTVGGLGAATTEFMDTGMVLANSGLSIGTTTIASDALIANGQGRFGGGIYVGSTGTAPTAACVHIPTGSLVGTTTSSMTKDTAISFTPANSQGMILVWRRSLTVSLTIWGLIFYNTSGPFTAIASGGSNLEVTTGALTGTTGTDTKLTVSCHTDGKIYIENRVITGLTAHYVMLGG